MSNLINAMNWRSGLRNITSTGVLCVLVPALASCTAAAPSGTGQRPVQATANVAQKAADETRAEATRSNSDATGHPLPLLATWNTGTVPTSPGLTPEYQVGLAVKGHHIMPSFAYPNISSDAPPRYAYDPSPQWESYYKAPLEQAAKLKLPITLISTQWDRLLSDDPHYFNLPIDQNPNVVTPEGKVLNKVSPFGPIELWREVGAKWAASPLMKQVQKWYPNPPLVMLMSNNEHRRLAWSDVEQDARYLKQYGTGRDDNFKRQVVAQGWIERYRALQEGMRAALVSKAWRENAFFTAYNAFGPPVFGRWGGWPNYALSTSGRIDPSPLMWDGGSPSYYQHSWNDATDFKVMSPQIEAMNWVFMDKEAKQLNPKFWFEISSWDGHVPPERTKDQHSDKRATYRALGQTYEPPRYEGFGQFGLWLLRPRAIRDFRNFDELQTGIEPYFLALANGVDRVYANDTLRTFWRTGELVPNHAQQHPYQASIPAEYKDVDRWYLLDTNLDAPRPWTLKTEILVFSLALVRGKAGERQWLVYAHSPLMERKDVEITIPDYGKIKVDVAVAGSFYIVDEKTKQVQPVQ